MKMHGPGNIKKPTFGLGNGVVTYFMKLLLRIFSPRGGGGRGRLNV
jgi:hypothetical protein